MKHLCRTRKIKSTYIRNKLRELQRAGVDVDKLPDEMTLDELIVLTPEAAKVLTK